MDHINIIDRLTGRSLREDGERTRLAVTSILPVALPLDTLEAGELQAFAVDAMLWRTTTAFDRFYLVAVKFGEISNVEEFSCREARDKAAREVR
jgi:hypothetical protein